MNPASMLPVGLQSKFHATLRTSEYSSNSPRRRQRPHTSLFNLRGKRSVVSGLARLPTDCKFQSVQVRFHLQDTRDENKRGRTKRPAICLPVCLLKLSVCQCERSRLMTLPEGRGWKCSVAHLSLLTFVPVIMIPHLDGPRKIVCLQVALLGAAHWMSNLT